MITMMMMMMMIMMMIMMMVIMIIFNAFVIYIYLRKIIKCLWWPVLSVY